MLTYTDETPMPFGQYKGWKMANIPAEYLIWIYNIGNTYGALKGYIEENMDALKAELKEKGE